MLAILTSVLVTAIGFQPTTASGLPTSGPDVECADVVFVGVRQSGTLDGHGELVWQAFQEFERQLEGKRSVAQRWLDYPALGTGTILRDVATSDDRYLSSMVTGQANLQRYLIDLVARCNSWIVLAGYSQGAGVIRLATTAFGAGAVYDQLAGTILFGDPTRHRGDGLIHLGGASESEEGVYHKLISRVGRSPDTAGFDGSYCLPGDDVCELGNTTQLLDDIALNIAGRGHETVHAKYHGYRYGTFAGARLARELLDLSRRPHPEQTATPADPTPAGPAPAQPAPTTPTNTNLLANPGYENGNTGWNKINFAANTNRSVYNNPSRSHTGTGFLEANVSKPGGSVGQDLSTRPQAGQTYTYSVWARHPHASGTQPATIAIWALGGTQESATADIQVTNQWREYQVRLDVRNNGHTGIRVEHYMHQTGRQYNYDNTNLVRGTLPPPARVPGAATAATATAGPAAGQVTASWTAAPHNGSAITSYRAVASPGGRTCTTATTSCTISGLAPGSYSVAVTATSAIGSGPSTSTASTPAAAVPASAPAVVWSVDGQQVRLHWFEIPSEPFPVTGYEVRVGGASVCTSSPSESSCELGRLGQQLEFGGTYSVTVAALNRYGTGPPNLLSLTMPATEDTSEVLGPELAAPTPSPGELDHLHPLFETRPDLGPQHSIVLRLYWAVLGRAPELEGARFWVEAFDSGQWSTRRIAAHFATSDEFERRYSNDLAGPAFLEIVYENVLGRPADHQGLAYWAEQLESGMTRGEVVLLISNSPEFIAAHPLPSDT